MYSDSESHALTVFTPAYNRAHTIVRTYESLCRQTCKDFEWLIVDDGSTDNLKYLVDGWIVKADFTIRYIYQDNQGMHGAHNTAYRNIRTELNVSPGKEISELYVVSDDENIRGMFEQGRVILTSLARAGKTCVQADKTGIADDAFSAVIHGATLYIPFADLVDLEKEKARLEKEQQRLQKEIKRSDGMLNNEKFLAKAPEAKVAEEREKREKYFQMLEQVEERLAEILAR